jgi:hypothetical protein
MEHSMKSSNASHHALRLRPSAPCSLWAQSAGAATTVVYSFQGEDDGASGHGVNDAVGNLYGTTTRR